MMEVGGLYWVNATKIGCSEPCVGFFDEDTPFIVGATFTIGNTYPVILLEAIHQGDDIYLFRCLTHKGVGERLAKADDFESWFLNDR